VLNQYYISDVIIIFLNLKQNTQKVLFAHIFNLKKQS